MVEERRRYKRLKGKEGAFAVFLRGNELLVLGNIVDISLGGLCVRYLSTAELSPNFYSIKIFGSNEKFIHLDRMDCKIVHVQKRSTSAPTQLDALLCGVELYNISFRQSTMLHEFIGNFSFDETNS